MSKDIKREFYIDLLEKGLIFEQNIKFPHSLSIIDKYKENPFFEPSSGAFRKVFLRSELFFDLMKELPNYIVELPFDYYSQQELWLLLKNNPISILSFTPEMITEAMFAYAVSKDERLFAFLPPEFQTQEIAVDVIKKEPLLLAYVRDDLLFYYLCRIAVEKNWETLQFVPMSIMDSQLIQIADSQPTAFLLDWLENSDITPQLYNKCMKLDPIRTANFLVEKFLTVDDVPYFIQAVTVNSVVTPELALEHGSLALFSSPSKIKPLVMLFELQPTWIEYLHPSCITPEMLQAVIAKGVVPTLPDVNWTAELVYAAYNENKQSILNIPREKLLVLGVDRFVMLFNEAVRDGWVEKIPNHFFIEEIVADSENKQALLEFRFPFSHIVNTAHDFDWNTLLDLDASIDELLILDQKAPHELAESLFNAHVENYVILNDADKTLDRTIAFLEKYSDKIELVPNHILKDPKSYQAIVNEYPFLLNDKDGTEAYKAILAL
ncbi:hypothetical protein [Acinetobacter sp. P1(2025)]|uniref:hypothetical protein n=1 Tax=Acinetobacter sp. P1(2025) TaxID=3446120 RepID=UPI003F5377F4